LWKLDQSTLLIWLLCILFTRAAFLRFADLNVFKRQVLVLGTGRKAARIAALGSARTMRQFTSVAYLRCGIDPGMVPAAAIDIQNGGLDVIAGCVRELHATEIVVATDDRRGLPVRELLRCRTAGIHVIDYLDFIERETKTVDLGALQPGWLIFSDGFRGSGLAARACKRGFDIVLSLVLLLFTLPLILLTCALIMIESPGPVLYRQERVGFGGRSFVLLKLRSMRADAEKDGAARWALTSDPRVTRVGRLIRKLRIDELPQLWNVLRGDMSFVGPRPERPCFVADFAGRIPFYAERHCVKPGITGWAQINYPYGASLEDARNKLSYDLYYVKNHGLFLDLVIVLQTIRVILWADGAR
jgi:sugar transferase (PEP-CTERM system associated)